MEIKSNYRFVNRKRLKLFNCFPKLCRGDVELLFEASIKEACVIEARCGCDACNRVGRGQQKIFCVVQTLLQEILGDGLSHVFFEGIANMLFGVGNILRDFADGHIV